MAENKTAEGEPPRERPICKTHRRNLADGECLECAQQRLHETELKCAYRKGVNRGLEYREVERRLQDAERERERTQVEKQSKRHDSKTAEKWGGEQETRNNKNNRHGKHDRSRVEIQDVEKDGGREKEQAEKQKREQAEKREKEQAERREKEQAGKREKEQAEKKEKEQAEKKEKEQAEKLDTERWNKVEEQLSALGRNVEAVLKRVTEPDKRLGNQGDLNRDQPSKQPKQDEGQGEKQTENHMKAMTADMESQIQTLMQSVGDLRGYLDDVKAELRAYLNDFKRFEGEQKTIPRLEQQTDWRAWPGFPTAIDGRYQDQAGHGLHYRDEHMAFGRQPPGYGFTQLEPGGVDSGAIGGEFGDRQRVDRSAGGADYRRIRHDHSRHVSRNRERRYE